MSEHEEVESFIVFDVKLADGDKKWMPERGHVDDAGFDLKVRAIRRISSNPPPSGGVLGSEEIIDEEGVLMKEEARVLIMTGVFIALRPGWEAQIRPRSGMALKAGITITNSPGTIDAGYRNEIGVILQTTTQSHMIKSGDKIAQMVIKRVPKVYLSMVDELEDTERGQSGFGSTGA